MDIDDVAATKVNSNVNVGVEVDSGFDESARVISFAATDPNHADKEMINPNDDAYKSCCYCLLFANFLFNRPKLVFTHLLSKLCLFTGCFFLLHFIR